MLGSIWQEGEKGGGIRGKGRGEFFGKSRLIGRKVKAILEAGLRQPH